MASYKELLEQREALTRKIEEARKVEIAGAVARVRAVVLEYDLKPEDIFTKTRARSGRVGVKVPPKYRDPVTGKTWTGRGKAPRWIADKDREHFLIKK